MSISVMTLIWGTDFPAHEKLVLLALADWSNEEGTCWPSQQTIASRCSCSDRNVRKILTSLTDAGFIKKQNRGRGGLIYTLDLDALKMRNPGTENTAVIRNHSSGINQKKAEPQFRNNPEKAEPQFRNKKPLIRNSSSGESGTPVPVLYEPPRTVIIPSTKKPSIPSVKKITPHAWFTKWWCLAFESRTGHRYSYSKKAAGIVTNLLRDLSLEEITGRACSYLSLSDSERFPRGAPTLEGLAAMVNQLAGRCNQELEDRFFEAGLLPDFDTVLIDFRPWEKNAAQSAQSMPENQRQSIVA